MTRGKTMTHPNGGFTDRNERLVRAGDRVRYLIDGREGTLDEALHDGDAFVTFDDGSFGTVRWWNLVGEKL